MADIRDVAAAAGVSIATVSRALRGLPRVSPGTRAAVEEAAARLDYVASPAAAGLVSGRQRAVAVVLPSLGRWFDTAVVEGADAVLRRAGYDAFLVDLAAGSGTRDRLFSNRLLGKRADAVLALGIDFSDEEQTELLELRLPYLVVGGSVGDLRHIGLDDEWATRLAMEHLLALGHRRIAHIGGRDEFGVADSVARIRRETWRAVLGEHALPAPDSAFRSGSFQLARSKAAALELLTGPDRPTAVFAGSDEMGFGALLAARDLDVAVPGELSVVGVDDHVWSGSFGLTTVHQSPGDQGAEAARVLLAELAGGDAGTVFGPHRDGRLVVRSSTGPVPTT